MLFLVMKINFVYNLFILSLFIVFLREEIFCKDLLYEIFSLFWYDVMVFSLVWIFWILRFLFLMIFVVFLLRFFFSKLIFFICLVIFFFSCLIFFLSVFIFIFLCCVGVIYVLLLYFCRLWDMWFLVNFSLFDIVFFGCLLDLDVFLRGFRGICCLNFEVCW